METATTMNETITNFGSPALTGAAPLCHARFKDLRGLLREPPGAVSGTGGTKRRDS